MAQFSALSLSGPSSPAIIAEELLCSRMHSSYSSINVSFCSTNTATFLEAAIPASIAVQSFVNFDRHSLRKDLANSGDKLDSSCSLSDIFGDYRSLIVVTQYL